MNRFNYQQNTYSPMPKEDDKTVYVNYEKETYQNIGSYDGMGNPLEGNTRTQNKLSPLDELYYKLGKAYYEGAFEDPLPELLQLFDKITELKRAGQQSKPSDVQVKPTVYAPQMNQHVYSTPQTPAKRQFCTNCGAKLEENARFCIRCGTSVEQMI